MSSVYQQATHESLLIRLQNIHDSKAWDQFYTIYRGLIIGYALRKGCSVQMSQDVLQETCITLTKKMPTFKYDRFKGRFRSFLLVIVKSRIIDAFRRENKHRIPNDSHKNEIHPSLNILENQTVNEWETEWNREWEKNLLLQALQKIKSKVNDRIYDSFRMYVLEKKPVAEVASVLQIPKDNIYEHRRRIVAMLRQEIRLLRSELGE